MKHLVASLLVWASLPVACLAQLNPLPSSGSNSSIPTGYWLGVETVTVHTEGDLAGMTTYRVYMNMQNTADYLSSCSGDAEHPLIFSSTTGSWYNNAFNTSWNASGLNPAFIALFPDMAYDSFLTIGAEDASTPASQQPSTVWGANNASAQFTGPGPGQNVMVDDAVGGAWYTPFPGIAAAETHVAFAGSDLKVLVAQFTTAGFMTGQIQVQVFVNGDQGDELRDLLPICSPDECGGCTNEEAMNYDPEALYDDGSCEFDPNGCIDETACNYEPNASVDDGSCLYFDACGVCGGTGEDADADGICDDVDNCVGTPEECETYGCTDELACNYNELATLDDGTCEFESCQWCDDPEACNYGAGTPWTANTDLCEYIAEGACDCDGNVLDAAGVCGGTCWEDADGDGVCDDVDECVGVVDACGVCNGPGAVYECGCNDIPEGQCDCEGTQIDAVGVCGGNCALDADGDGWCDECINTPVEGYALETEVVVEHTSGNLAGMTTYRVYARCTNPDDYVNACSGDNLNPLVIESASGSWFNHALNTGFNAAGVNPALFGDYPNLEYDSYLTIGAESSDITANLHPATIWGDIDASEEFTGDGSGFNITVDDNTGGAWYLPFPGAAEADIHPGFAGDDLRVLVMQMTTVGPISGQIQLQIFQNADQLQEIREVFLYNSEYDVTDCDNLDPCFGVFDECGVCEGPGAVFDCGCTVLPAGDCDCDGNQEDAIGVCGGDCVQDVDGDGVCDLVAEGCSDEAACNYVVAVMEDGSCIYPEPYYDCNGECMLDSDADGVCDELEIDGCMDETACNYDAAATDDDGSCAELDECGECGGTGYLACTDPVACNYDAGASCDDGSCTYAEQYYDCDGVCLADADLDGVCDEFEVVGCQDETACNYDELATDEGECFYADLFYDCEGNCLTDTDGDGVCNEFEVPGCTDEAACNYDATATDDDGSCAEFDACGECGGSGVLGCTDEMACNYDQAATCDDGMCTYAEDYYDCDGACLADADGDGICNELEVPGCTDETACNYDATATDDDGSCAEIDACGECGGSGVLGCTDEMACNYDGAATCDDGMCTYAEDYYDCDGACLADADGDGVCDELEVVGCQDETACNYDELATDEGECEYAAEFYDCDGNCVNDADGDGICDEQEVPGCTDVEACNYDETATDDDGTCEYAEEFYDCDGNCLSDADGDGVCDELEVAGCTYEAACNYDPAATDDDGSCAYPGDACDDGDDTTINDALNEECECVGEVDGVEEAAALTWTLYPSPVRDVLNLRLEGGAWSGAIDGDVEVMVLGATGQVLRSERLAGRTQLDVSDLASGIYFLTLRSPAMAATTRRFVVAGGE